MTAIPDTTQQKTWETCPLCGLRKRRSDCLVCPACKKAFIEPVNEQNAKALASGDAGSLVDIFEMVLTKGYETFMSKRDELGTAEAEKKEREDVLWKNAEQQIISFLRAQEARVTAEVRNKATVVKLRELKQEDETFHSLCGKVTGLTKAIESLEKHLAGIKQKHEDYKRKRAEQPAEKEVAEVAA